MPKTEDDFLPPIRRLMREAQQASRPFVDIQSGDVHKDAGDYPGPDHRMSICCRVMKNEMRSGDRILFSPPSGQGATLEIRYMLPRR